MVRLSREPRQACTRQRPEAVVVLDAAFRGPGSASSWFDNLFATRLAASTPIGGVSLGQPGNLWRLRLCALDTSAEAQFSAQGFASRQDVDALSLRLAGDEGDIVVVMHHHYPVRASNSRKKCRASEAF